MADNTPRPQEDLDGDERWMNVVSFFLFKEKFCC